MKISKEGVMKKMMLLVCGMIFAASVFGGDFAKDFQSAINLYNGGKYPESEDAFVKLNEQNATPKGTDESHAYEDFEKWPDPMKYSAYVCRGNAYFRVKNAENAEKDFLAAMKNTVEKLDKAYVNMSLGNVYRDVGMDNQPFPVNMQLDFID